MEVLNTLLTEFGIGTLFVVAVALLAWRVKRLEAKLDNGLNAKVERLLVIVARLQATCEARKSC